MNELPLDGLSPSSIELWQQCPRRFYEEKFAGRLLVRGGVEAFLGTFVHLVLERFMQRPAWERTVETAQVDARLAWAEFSAEQDWQDFCDEADFDVLGDEGRSFRWRGWLSVCGLWRIEDPQHVDVVATEQMLGAMLGTAPVRGIVDRLDRIGGHLVVVDYKTGKVPKPQFMEAKDRQLAIYAAILDQQGQRPSFGRLLFTTHQRELNVAFTDDAIDGVTRLASATWAEIGDAYANDVWPAKPGPLCGWCPFIEDCPQGLAEVTRRSHEGRLAAHAPAWALIEGR